MILIDTSAWIDFKTVDLLIATYALTHSAAVLTTDKDFLAMQKAGVPLHLA